jgi:hypothetical protein
VAGCSRCERRRAHPPGLLARRRDPPDDLVARTAGVPIGVDRRVIDGNRRDTRPCWGRREGGARGLGRDGRGDELLLDGASGGGRARGIEGDGPELAEGGDGDEHPSESKVGADLEREEGASASEHLPRGDGGAHRPAAEPGNVRQGHRRERAPRGGALRGGECGNGAHILALCVGEARAPAGEAGLGVLQLELGEDGLALRRPARCDRHRRSRDALAGPPYPALPRPYRSPKMHHFTVHGREPLRSSCQMFQWILAQVSTQG